MEKFVMELQERLGEEGLKLQEPMKERTTFRVGGPADLFLMPANAEELKDAIEILRKHEVPVMVIGNGSNLLVRDKGWRSAQCSGSKGCRCISDRAGICQRYPRQHRRCSCNECRCIRR